MKDIVETVETKIRLSEVDAIRSILVVLLVLYHSFCMYDNKWELCANAYYSDSYKWLSRFAYAFLLQGYFFMSGYVWAFQREVQNKNESFLQLVKSKSIRLLLPSLSFGVVYYLLFYNGAPISSENVSIPISDSIMYVLNGPGHLWFLPALFWCFVLTFLLNKFKLTPLLKLLITIICAILPYIALPFRLGWAMFYILYFYLGYFAFLNRDFFIRLSTKVIYTWGGYLLFIGVFVLLYCLKDALPTLIGNKYLFRSASQMVEIVYSTLGLTSFYLIITRLSNKYTTLFKNITWLGRYSFSIYIFQEFILRIIYYKTDISACLPSSVIPWFGFLVALALSALLSITIKKL